MARVENIEALQAKLRGRAAASKNDDDASVIVSFSTNYAIFVHENLEAHHPVGQAKFLEQPARELGKELGQIVREAKAKGVSLGKALYLAGLRLQREAQQLCPVDTGNLRASGQTELEGQK